MASQKSPVNLEAVLVRKITFVEKHSSKDKNETPRVYGPWCLFLPPLQRSITSCRCKLCAYLRKLIRGQQGLLPFPKGVRTKYPHLVSQLFAFSQLLISAYSVTQSFRQKRSSAWGQAHTRRCTHTHAPQQSPE